MATTQLLLPLIALAPFVGGCGNNEAASPPPDADEAREIHLLGNSPQRPSAAAGPQQDIRLDVLVDSLARLEGSFERTSLGTFSFRGDESLFGSFYEYGDSAVVALVECLDNSNPAAATFQGQHVPIGYMCYTALKRTAYPTAHEDDAGDWPGVLLNPIPTAQELAAAKEAWDTVVKSGAYRIAVISVDRNQWLASATCRHEPARSKLKTERRAISLRSWEHGNRLEVANHMKKPGHCGRASSFSCFSLRRPLRPFS